MISQTKFDQSSPQVSFYETVTVLLSILTEMEMEVVFYHLSERTYYRKFYHNNIEGFSVEINLRNKKKCLVSCSYNPKKALISNHFAELSKKIDLYLSKQDQLLFLGDFIAEVEDSLVNNFCYSFNLTSMINKPTCFRNSDEPS